MKQLKQVKRAALKGFTLIELIVVMAIFSLIMFGAMQLMDPVTRIFNNTSQFETATANMDNMKRYLEGTLRYASRLEVHCDCDLSETQIKAYVDEFWRYYFEGRQLNEQSGTIYALALKNPVYDESAGAWVPDASGQEGYAMEYAYTFENNATLPTLSGTPASCVNPVVYGGQGGEVDYRFHYAYYLGEWNIDSVDTEDSHYMLTVANPETYFSANNFTMTIHMIDDEVDAIYKATTASFAFTNILDVDRYGSTRTEAKYILAPTAENPDAIGSTTIEMFRGIFNNQATSGETGTYLFIYTLPNEGQICHRLY